jgi:hypothetical protein
MLFVQLRIAHREYKVPEGVSECIWMKMRQLKTAFEGVSLAAESISIFIFRSPNWLRQGSKDSEVHTADNGREGYRRLNGTGCGNFLSN